MTNQNYSGDYFLSLLRGVYQKSGIAVPTAEFSTLQRLVDAERAEYETMRSWLRVRDSRIGSEHVDLPFAPIYSQTFDVDTAALNVPVTGIYKHLFIYGQGRITGAGGGTVFCQFNGDTGANYQWIYILGNGTTVSSGQDTSDSRIVIGQFSNTGDPAGSASTFEAKILNYFAPTHQMVMANTLYNDNTTRSIYSIAGKWSSTAGIKSIEIFACDATGIKGSTNMAAGSVISIYGMK
jgi:hypothetical protein